ncbi:cold shock and DUF1294 domain-containing protein [Halomonas sp. ML-15]|uniref:DUF1294 domain-containing protein n=1 Tax=Halomonas sp. ML-15 TaxID=2773305 RepID=UPI001746E779|nr:cold shock and DUF1294 domain-containing protein [Halomonas sp. ML-15]MBD3895020.1 cold shock and DUF1294 domain-containing protein [Halomonas sp. ML-15]
MRHEGKLIDWNDDKGVGFITPLAGGSRVFVHITDFPRGSRRPRVDEQVSYAVARDKQDRPRARKVLFLRSASLVSPRTKGLLAACGVVATFFGFLAALRALEDGSLVLVGAYALISAITFTLYGVDKAAAGKGSRRTAETTLHFMSLIGGWPGALIAQRLFRHKTRKQPFQVFFLCATVANCAAFAWLLYSDKAAGLRAGLGFG